MHGLESRTWQQSRRVGHIPHRLIADGRVYLHVEVVALGLFGTACWTGVACKYILFTYLVDSGWPAMPPLLHHAVARPGTARIHPGPRRLALAQTGRSVYIHRPPLALTTPPPGPADCVEHPLGHGSQSRVMPTFTAPLREARAVSSDTVPLDRIHRQGPRSIAHASMQRRAVLA